MPGGSRELSEGQPPEKTLTDGATQGKNDFGKLGYGGPAPPPGKRHRYYFRLYALDTELSVPAGATKDQVMKSIEGHILAEAELIYSR